MSSTFHQRRRWAYALIRRASAPPPTYGSEAWLALPDGSEEKIAAVVIAAECWAIDGEDIAGQLRRDLDNQMAAQDRLDAELHEENVDMVKRLATRPGIGTSYSERRAKELEDAVRPRPGDRPPRSPLSDLVRNGREPTWHTADCPGCDVDPALRGVAGVECRPKGITR